MVGVRWKMRDVNFPGLTLSHALAKQ